MIKALFSVLIVCLVIIVVLTCVCYWLFSYATLEKLGYADVEITQVELPNGEKESITARSIGIENMTMKELLAWFNSRRKAGMTAS